MRTRSLGLAFLAMVLMFPLLISAVSPRPLGRPSRGLRAGLPMPGSEMILVGGLILAGRERRGPTGPGRATAARHPAPRLDRGFETQI